MKNKLRMLAVVAALVSAGSCADTFGTGTNPFELTFQPISSGSNPASGYGIVGYDYGIGTHEITADQSASSAFRHTDAVYVLPSEDEWVKAAYWNGTSLQTYSTPGNTLSGMNVNYNNNIGSVWNVGTGTEEINGTHDMMGNVWEWNESGLIAPDDSATKTRVIRGGAFYDSIEYVLRSSARGSNDPTSEDDYFGFRVAAITAPPPPIDPTRRSRNPEY